MGLHALYTIFILFLFFQPLDQGRKLFAFFDPALGQPLPERSYAEDCSLYTPDHPESQFYNIYDAVVDIHFAAHLFGWWFKMMIIRDLKICWVTSAGFEVLEITFRHWLPNFYECWWDHLLLDLFGCNLLGIILGAISCRYL